MDRDRIHSEIKTLIEQSAAIPADLERLSDNMTTRVMVAASPGQVCGIDSVEERSDGYACRFQTVYPNQLARIGFFNTALIPHEVAAALRDLAA